MVETICFVLILLMLIYGWRLDSRFALVLSPFMIFSAYFILRVVPGFYVGVNGRYDVNMHYIAILPVAYGAFFFAYFFSGHRPLDKIVEYSLEVCQLSRRELEKPVLFFMGIVVVSGFLLYKGIPPAINVAIEVASNSIDAREAAGIVSEARREISKGHVFNDESQGSGVFREIIFASAILMLAFASVYFFSAYGVRAGLLLFSTIFVAYVFVSGDGTRGRFVVVFTVVLIVFTVLRRVRLKHAVLGAALLLLVSVLLGSYTNKMALMFEDGAWHEIIRAASERIFIGNSINDATAISAVESGSIELGYGYWIVRDFFAFIPGVNFDKPLAYYLYLYEIGGTSTTYLTGTLIGRAFADGGLVGVFVYFGALGYVSRRSHYIIRFVPALNAGEKVAFICVCWLAAGQGYVSGLPGVAFMLGITAFLAYIYGLTNVKFKA